MSVEAHRLISLPELGLKEDYSDTNFDKCVRRLELTEGLFLCAAFNHVSVNSIHNDFSESQWFISNALDFDTKVRERAQSFLKAYPGSILLGRVQLLHLMLAIALKSRDTPKGCAKPERPNDFMQAAIKADFIANAEWFHTAINPDKHLSKEERARLRLPAIRVMAQFGILFRNPYQRALGRLQTILVDEMFNKDVELADIFFQRTGMTVEDFIYAAAAVLIVGLKSNVTEHPAIIPASYFKFSGHGLWEQSPHNKDVIEKFLQTFSMTPNEFKEALDEQPDKSISNYTNFKPLRRRPIIKAHTDTYIVADTDFLIRAVEVGPLFQIMDNDKRKPKQVFGYFGDAFERYCQRIISEYNTNLDQHNSSGYFSKNVFENGSRKEIDISLTYDETLVIIECKAVWLADEYLSKKNYLKFWDDVEAKLGVSINPDTKKEERKGYAQLADLVRLISLKDSSFTDSKVRPENLKMVFPVLLVHDSLFSVGEYGYLLALKFAQLLGQDDLSASGYFEYNGLQVANLILLTADEIEWLISRDSKDSILNHLKSYTEIAPTRLEKSFGVYIHENLPPSVHSKNPLTEPTKILFDTVIERFLPSTSKNPVNTE